MAILTKELQQQIIREWMELKKKIDNEISPYFRPQSGLIPVNPVPFSKRPGYHNKKITPYRKEIKEWAQENGYKTIKSGCYFYVTFRLWRENEKPFPDVDNLLKAFFDAIKEGVLIEDDGQIIGVKSNLVKLYGSEEEQESVSFNLIPAYDLEIISVDDIKKEDSNGLNELRRKYAKEIKSDWEKSMQMVKTNRGVFYDNVKGKLWSIEAHEKGKNFLHKPEPGFDWKSKIGKKVGGVMIYERSGCWWINKWAE